MPRKSESPSKRKPKEKSSHGYRPASPERIINVAFDLRGKAVGVDVGGRRLPASEAQDLASQCRTMVELPAFRLLLESMKSEACQKLYYDSKTLDDLTAAKTMLWTVTEIDRQANMLAKVVPMVKAP